MLLQSAMSSLQKGGLAPRLGGATDKHSRSRNVRDEILYQFAAVRLAMAAEMLNPRTAIGETSIWSLVGEVQFQRNISTLWKATRGRPKEPQTYLVAVPGVHNDGVLPIALELQLVNGMASIATAEKGVECVSAAVIEIPRYPSIGLRFSLAANEGISQMVKDCLDKVIASVRRVAREGQSTKVTIVGQNTVSQSRRVDDNSM